MSFKIVQKYMHPLSNVDNNRKEIEDQRHIVTNI